jgi:DNA-binding MarR family transcriptional regulator
VTATTVDDDQVQAFLTASRAMVGPAVHSIEEAGAGVTVTQHRLLVLVAAHGSRTINEVADELGVAQSNASRSCDRLARLGLLERRRSPDDRRVVQVALTRAGRRLLDDVTRVRSHEIERVLAAMSPEERAVGQRAMLAFSAAADELPDSRWAARPG